MSLASNCPLRTSESTMFLEHPSVIILTLSLFKVFVFKRNFLKDKPAKGLFAYRHEDIQTRTKRTADLLFSDYEP
jgi:hypothetical protein